MPVYPSYDFIDVLALEGEPAPDRGARHERSRRRAHRTAERRQVGAVQSHRRRRQRHRLRRGRHDARPPLRARRVERPRRSGSSIPAASSDDPQAPMDVEIRRQVDEAIERGGPAAVRRRRARSGLHPSDSNVAEMLRGTRESRGCSSPTRWTIRASADFYEFYQLGVGDPFPGLGASTARTPAICSTPSSTASRQRRREDGGRRCASRSSAGRTSGSRRS